MLAASYASSFRIVRNHGVSPGPGSSGESVVSAASSVPIGPRKRSSVGMSLPICDTPFAYMLRGMRSVACVTEEHEFFDCDQGFAEVFELDFPELCCGDHDFACSGSRMLAAPPGRTHDLCSRTHDRVSERMICVAGRMI